MREAGGLICNLDHREADDLFADQKSLLENLSDHIIAQAFLFDVHHGVVPRGVKCLSDLAGRGQLHRGRVLLRAGCGRGLRDDQRLLQSVSAGRGRIESLYPSGVRT